MLLRRIVIIFLLMSPVAKAQEVTPAHVKSVMDRVLNYLTEVTPASVINRQTGQPITELKQQPQIEAALAKSEYRLETHEWGLTYSAMLLAHGRHKRCCIPRLRCAADGFPLTGGALF
jgi:hypothetical protein